VCDAVWCGIKVATHFSEERTACMVNVDRDTALKLEEVRSSEA
jgi:hypothetical protein